MNTCYAVLRRGANKQFTALFYFYSDYSVFFGDHQGVFKNLPAIRMEAVAIWPMNHTFLYAIQAFLNSKRSNPMIA